VSTTDNLTIDRYKLVNCVATGHHSQVWEAMDPDAGKRVAIKVLLPEALKDPSLVAAMKHEFRAGKSFEHPNIVKYYDSTINRKQAYFTMEYFPAPNLKSWFFSDLHAIQLRFKRLVELVGSALEHIHDRGWIHRDIKPDNILMNKSTEVRLIDFSLADHPAGALARAFGKRTKQVKGTRTYMAPEQILGRPLSIQTDIYNFGVTLFELLTGQCPFKAASPQDLLTKHVTEKPPCPSFFNPNVTEQMDQIVLKMLSKKPEQRHKKMSEFLVEFRGVTVFKEAIVEKVVKSEEEIAREMIEKTLGERLDSRTDALRTKTGMKAPAAPVKKKPSIPPPAASKPPQPAAVQQGAPAAALGSGQGVGQGTAPAPRSAPQPMMPQPGYPAPGMMPAPGYPAPFAPAGYPQGPAPWMGQPMPGAQAGPWVMQPQQNVPQPNMQQPGAPLPVPAQPPAPVAPPRPPAASVPVVQPASPRPAAASKPAVAPPAPKAPAKPAASKPGEGFSIDDLPGFDQLPSA
jgi:eukaryotic-like serine/threonine-protein kinase